MSHVVKQQFFLKNIADFSAVNEIYADFFPQEPPARSTIERASYPKERYRNRAIAIRKSRVWTPKQALETGPASELRVLNPPLRRIVQLTNSAAIAFSELEFQQ